MAAKYDLSDLGPENQAYDLSDLGPKGAPSVSQQNPSYYQQFGNDIRDEANLASRTAGNIITGLSAPGRFISNIPHYLFPSSVPESPKVNWVNNPTIKDNLIQGMSAYGPIGLASKLTGLPAFAESATAGLGRAAPVAANMLEQGAVGGLTGAVQSDNPMEGALTGAALGAGGNLALGGASKLYGLAKNAFDFVRPQKFVNQTLDRIGSGRSLEENGKSLAQDVQNAYERRQKESSDLYNGIKDKVGPYSESNALNINGKYGELEPDIIKSFDRKLGNLNSSYLKEPSYDNAHQLQSQLGSSIRKMQSQDARGQLTVADRKIMQGYQEAQDAVRNDINSYLENRAPGLSQEYEHATQNHVENVVPYIENSKIAQIAKDKINNPRNVANIFRNPEAGMQKIINDLGPEAKNKVLYSELGKPGYQKATDFAKGIDNLDRNGLAGYLSPELEQQLSVFPTLLRNRKLAKTGASLGIAGTALSAYPELKNLILPKL